MRIEKLIVTVLNLTCQAKGYEQRWGATQSDSLTS
jgi:hypothetical protein